MIIACIVTRLEKEFADLIISDAPVLISDYTELLRTISFILADLMFGLNLWSKQGDCRHILSATVTRFWHIACM